MQKGRFDAEDQSKEPSSKKEPKKKPDPKHATSQSTSPNKQSFTATDFEYLAKNEHSRYAPNSKKVGHTVLTERNNQTVAVQYAMPQVNDDQAPSVRPLINIEAVEPFRGMHRFRAETPNGTPMFGKRFIEGTLGDKQGDESFRIACFSPSTVPGKDPFWGSMKETPLFRDDLSRAVKKDLQKDLKDIKKVTKGGALQVDHASVPQRDKMTSRTPDQNTVMGESARDAYEHFFDKLSDELHPDMKQRLKRAFKADIKDPKVNSYRPEWLHAQGWSLMPMSIDPQTKDNLGAAPKWANTQMMVLERIVKWFALNAPESLLSIKPQFDMLLDSDLIEHIDFSVKIQIKERFVELAQSIDPFLAWPLFSKASDLAQGAAITHSMLHNVPPVSEQIVLGAKKASSKKTEQATPLFSSSPGQISGSRLSVPHSEVVEARSKPTPNAVLPKRKREEEVTEPAVAALPPKKKHKSAKSEYPTQQNHDRSVVQVFSEFFTPDYDNPWRAPESSACTGSGFVIEDAGKKYIMTNAHVAENTTYLRVRLANDRLRKYEAKVKCVSYQCDLALLEIDDPEFQRLAQPVEFGEMVSLRQKVMVVGFPMGGTEISLSKGIISRIQVDTYALSGERLLQAQVDAAINPGNSGGPTYSNGKVIGVAFQGVSFHQGLNYIIPMPIVNHFLTEALGTRKYRGFPNLPIVTEELENQNERAFYQLGTHTGIRIKSIDNLSDAYSKLKADDIILSIDGLPVSNEGTVDIPGIGNCIDYYQVNKSKFIGDTVALRILRKNQETGSAEELEVDVVLNTICGDTEIVGVEEHDKMPTFYINSGVCFVPLTRNYMEGSGCEFEEMVFAEGGCALPDMPKKEPGDQIVVINQIFKCDDTQGYDKHINSIVKEINGKTIKNIKDVLVAMEGNKTQQHVITVAGKSKIVIPNMLPDALKKLLKRNHIHEDRSSDLVSIPTAVTPSNSPTLEQLRQAILAPIPIKPQAANNSGLIKSKIKRVIVDSSSDEEEAENDAMDVDDDVLTADMFPGLRRYRETISEMEERYKNLPENDEEDEDDDDYVSETDEDAMSVDSASSNQAEETDVESDNEAIQPPPKLSRHNPMVSNARFFRPAQTVVEIEEIRRNQMGK